MCVPALLQSFDEPVVGISPRMISKRDKVPVWRAKKRERGDRRVDLQLDTGHGLLNVDPTRSWFGI